MRLPGWKRVVVSIVLITVALIHLSCKSLGRKAVEGISERRDTLAAAVRPAARAAVEEMGGAFRDSVRPKLEDAVAGIGQTARPIADSLLDSLLDSLETRVERLQDSLEVFVAGEASDAVKELLRKNMHALSVLGDSAIAQWTATLAARLDSPLAAAAGRATSSMTGQALDTVGARLDSTRNLSAAVESLGARVVRQAIGVIAEETRRKPPWWVWAGVIAFGLVVVSLVGRFVLALVRENRRRETSLRVVARAIQERGEHDVVERVKGLASEQGVEGWLHDFLRERRLLLEDDAS